MNRGFSAFGNSCLGFLVIATLALAEERLPDGLTLTRSQDVLGRAAGISMPDYAVEYGYDAYGRFGSVTSSVSSVSSVVNYSYVQGSDMLAGWSSNAGMSFRRTYETHRDLISSVTNSWNGTAVSSFAYTNDELGRRTARTDNGSVTNLFGYNLRSEVTSALMGANEFGYAYDPIGNRLTATNNAAVTTYAANELNQYTNIVTGASVTPTYDDDGNMATYGPWAFAWDGENRLIGVSSNSVAVATNAYDYMSRRVAKTSQGVMRSYQYDGWNLLRETSGTNVTQYVWGLDLSQSLQGAGGVGGLLETVRDGAAYFPAYDANGNVTDYANASGSIIAHYEYDPFGGLTYQTGVLAEQFAYRFSTKYWDAEITVYYYGYRYYSPELGKWLSRDPLGEQGGINIYAFCGNDSLGLVDALGLIPEFMGGDFLNPILNELAGCADRLAMRAQSSTIAFLAEMAAQSYAKSAKFGTVEATVEWYGTTADATEAVIYNQLKEGESLGYAAMVGFSYAAGHLIGYTPLLEGVYGVDLASGQEIHGLDRTARTAGGASQMAFTGLMLYGSLNANMQTGRLSAAAESEMVSLWKGPAKFNEVGGKLIPRQPALEVAEGFDPALYPGKGPFFGIGEAGKTEALSWANYYKNGLQEIKIPKSVFDSLVEQGIIRADELYAPGVAVHVPAEGLPAFNSSIKGGSYLPPGAH